MTEDLKKIKKQYGEKMMHLCRELFPTLLEKEGLLSKLMIDNFAPSKFLYEDIMESKNIESFINYIYSLVDVEEKEEIEVNKTPKELLEEAGYILYECKTEEDIQSFKKYYAPREKLCTFNGGRLNRCHVFFAVKKNVEEIKRENFNNPKRQDEYGTSVISIQFTKGRTNTLSIKNRYNHTVNNPDATYSNNLENIIEGLTKSFEKEYKLNINQNDNRMFELPGYVKANDGKYYKYNYEINNKYYCPNNIIIDDFEVKQYELEKYIVLDYFILDLVNKEIKLYDNRIGDSFTDGIKDIDRINITKSKETGNKQIEIITKDKNQIMIEIDKTNQIIGYKNNDLKEIGENFLCSNESLINLDLPNLQQVGSYFLYFNRKLSSVNLPNLKKVGDKFLVYNKGLLTLDLPSLTQVGKYFLYHNENLISLSIPKLKKTRDYFLSCNRELTHLELPNLIMTGDSFCRANKKLTHLDLPKLERVGENFLFSNEDLTAVNLPNLKIIGDYFLRCNRNLTIAYLPRLELGSKLSLKDRIKVVDSIEEKEELYESTIKGAKKTNDIIIPKIKDKEIKEGRKGKK